MQSCWFFFLSLFCDCLFMKLYITPFFFFSFCPKTFAEVCGKESERGELCWWMWRESYISSSVHLSCKFVVYKIDRLLIPLMSFGLECVCRTRRRGRAGVTHRTAQIWVLGAESFIEKGGMKWSHRRQTSCPRRLPPTPSSSSSSSSPKTITGGRF